MLMSVIVQILLLWVSYVLHECLPHFRNKTFSFVLSIYVKGCPEKRSKHIKHTIEVIKHSQTAFSGLDDSVS